MRTFIGSIGSTSTFTLSELKSKHPSFFSKGNKKFFGITKQKLYTLPKKHEWRSFGNQVLIERHTNPELSYAVRIISPDGNISGHREYKSLNDLSKEIGKNIIL